MSTWKTGPSGQFSEREDNINSTLKTAACSCSCMMRVHTVEIRWNITASSTHCKYDMGKIHILTIGQFLLSATSRFLSSSMKVSFGFLNVERVGYVGCGQTFSKEENMATKEAAAGKKNSIRFSHCLDSSESLSLGRVFEVVRPQTGGHIVWTVARVYLSGGYLRWLDLGRVDWYLSQRVDWYLSIWQRAVCRMQRQYQFNSQDRCKHMFLHDANRRNIWQ